jgi:hypothetical protein
MSSSGGDERTVHPRSIADSILPPLDVTFATEPTPGRRNDDHVVASDSYLVMLDGVTEPPRADTGCVHDVPWFVHALGGLLVTGLSAADGATLRAITADAIEALRRRHARTCDLTSPDTPAATLAMLRAGEHGLDYLVLCDSSIVLEHAGGYRAITDDRTARLTAYDRMSVARMRNAPGGFWVASTDPAAAGEALAGTIPPGEAGRAAVLTDGAARLVEHFGRGWPEVFALATEHGPRAVLEEVRRREAIHPAGRGKRFDDATFALCTALVPA